MRSSSRRLFFSRSPFTRLALLAALAAGCSQEVARAADAASAPVKFRKINDVVIYEDPLFHAAFPSVIRRPDGEVWVAFRRAPERRRLGESKTYHVDANSYLVMVKSKDGQNWGRDPQPELIYAHPFGGSQDPCLLQLKDHSILCATYGWTLVRNDGRPALKRPYLENLEGYIFNGGYVVRSTDGGQRWQGPLYPPHIAPEILHDAYGTPVPAYNRGALYEGRDGRIFWVVAATDREKPQKTSTHLLVSKDKGVTWSYECPVAVDEKVTFNETSVYETPKGDVVAFLRTGDFDDHACIARSTDGGKTFQPWEDMGFQGHPLHALRLRDNRVLLTYGYRHKPYGVRARVLNPECTDYATATEFVLREDGGSVDLGYPWSVRLDGKRVLIAYYFNVPGGPQHIAGSVVEIE